MQLHIVQKEGQRIAVKLEAAFWSALKLIGRREGMRINDLLFDRVFAPNPGSDLEPKPSRNRTSDIRVFCVDWLVSELDKEWLTAGQSNIADIVNTAPGECCVLSWNGAVIMANAAFIDWTGIDAARLQQTSVRDLLKVTVGQRFDAVQQLALRPGQVFPVERSIGISLEGRFRGTRARICPVNKVEIDGQMQCQFLLFLVGRS